MLSVREAAFPPRLGLQADDKNRIDTGRADAQRRYLDNRLISRANDL